MKYLYLSYMVDYRFKANNRFEIMTPSGFQPFGGMRCLNKTSIYTITFSNGKTLKCSDNHSFMLDGEKILASDLVIGSKISSVDNRYVDVVSIECTDMDTTLYDIVEVCGGNIFNVDGVVSHNCDFISSGYTVVDGSVLEWYNETYITEPVEKRGFDVDVDVSVGGRCWC